MEDFFCHLFRLHRDIHHCPPSPSNSCRFSTSLLLRFLSLSLSLLLSEAAPTPASYPHADTASDLETAQCWCHTWMRGGKTGISPLQKSIHLSNLHATFFFFLITYTPSHSECVSTDVAQSQDAHNAALSTKLTRKKRDNLVLCWHTWMNWPLTLATMLLLAYPG